VRCLADQKNMRIFKFGCRPTALIYFFLNLFIFFLFFCKSIFYAVLLINTLESKKNVEKIFTDIFERLDNTSVLPTKIDPCPVLFMPMGHMQYILLTTYR
jgi:hypothetical protein